MKTYPTNQILKNKIAIITGAGSGIGKCMVERFVQEGAQCLAADLNQDSLNALVEDLGDFAGMVRTLQVDVSDRKSRWRIWLKRPSNSSAVWTFW